MILLVVAGAGIIATAGYLGYSHFKTHGPVAASVPPRDSNAGGTAADSIPAKTTPESAPPATVGAPAIVTAPVVTTPPPAAPPAYVAPHWIPWPIPEDKDSVVALYFQASHRPPTGAIQAGATFEGFIATSTGLGITKVRLRFDRAEGATVVGDGTGCSLEPMDATGTPQALRGRVMGGEIKFEASGGGQSSNAKEPHSVFEGGPFGFRFFVDQFGLVGTAEGVDWIVLLEPDI